MITYSMQSGGFLYSGHDAGPLMGQLENWGAAAVGFQLRGGRRHGPPPGEQAAAVYQAAADLQAQRRQSHHHEKGQAEYKLEPEPFARIVKACYENGASFLGGCCGTTPAHMAALKKSLDR